MPNHLRPDVRRSLRRGGPSLTWLRSPGPDRSRPAPLCPCETPTSIPKNRDCRVAPYIRSEERLRGAVASPAPQVPETLAAQGPLPAGKSARNRFQAPLAFSAVAEALVSGRSRCPAAGTAWPGSANLGCQFAERFRIAACVPHRAAVFALLRNHCPAWRPCPLRLPSLANDSSARPGPADRG